MSDQKPLDHFHSPLPLTSRLLPPYWPTCAGVVGFPQFPQRPGGRLLVTHPARSCVSFSLHPASPFILVPAQHMLPARLLPYKTGFPNPPVNSLSPNSLQAVQTATCPYSPRIVLSAGAQKSPANITVFPHPYCSPAHPSPQPLLPRSSTPCPLARLSSDPGPWQGPHSLEAQPSPGPAPQQPELH